MAKYKAMDDSSYGSCLSSSESSSRRRHDFAPPPREQRNESSRNAEPITSERQRSSAGRETITSETPIPVLLNVYSLSAGCLRGAYHSGIECMSREYAFFADDGIANHQPKRAPIGEYKNTILLGHVEWAVFENVLFLLQDDFSGENYDLVNRNCNDFTNAVCEILFDKSIPGKINRLARVGRKRGISRCLPICCGITPRKPWDENSAPLNSNGNRHRLLY